jgi:lysophospholipid acyltransferase (LPLAT)-like uncharacterized protein
VIARGGDVAITPDGPRGPVYQLNDGIVFLAQRSGAAVMPVTMEFSRAWRLKSWDGFFLPRPFATVRVIFDHAHRVGATASDQEFEAERNRLQDAMMSLVEIK